MRISVFALALVVSLLFIHTLLGSLAVTGGCSRSCTRFRWTAGRSGPAALARAPAVTTAGSSFTRTGSARRAVVAGGTAAGATSSSAPPRGPGQSGRPEPPQPGRTGRC